MSCVNGTTCQLNSPVSISKRQRSHTDFYCIGYSTAYITPAVYCYTLHSVLLSTALRSSTHNSKCSSAVISAVQLPVAHTRIATVVTMSHHYTLSDQDSEGYPHSYSSYAAPLYCATSTPKQSSTLCTYDVQHTTAGVKYNSQQPVEHTLCTLFAHFQLIALQPVQGKGEHDRLFHIMLHTGFRVKQPSHEGKQRKVQSTVRE